MNTLIDAGLRAISDLPELSEFAPGSGADGYSEDFSELFGRTEARLLKSMPRNKTTIRSNGVIVFRNRDLLEMAANPAVGNMLLEHHHLSYQRFARNLVLTTNPPIHGPMRQVIARPLSPKQIPRLAQVAKRVAADLVDAAIEQSEIDFCSQFSERFAARFWGALFGMTDDEVERLTETVRAMAPVFLSGRTPEEITAISVAMDEYLELVANAIHRALERGGNELLESMAAAFNAVTGESRPARLGEMIAANAFDGLHTAALACTNVLYQLLRSPNDLTAVRADLSLVPNAVAEGLRLCPPIVVLDRYALLDLEFAGTSIPRGTAISMLWAAGNRDPEVFEHPNQYDLFRSQRPDTTFGGGVHICPGRYLVRMLTHVMLEAVLAADIRIELTGDHPTWVARSSARQLNHMRVTVRRR